MNEQLIKLGIQAGLMTGEKEQLFLCRPTAQFDEYSPELEKFADLVVLECIKMVENEAEQYAEPTRAVELVNDMHERFGIKP
jgi:hypothetical protein